MAPTAEQFLHAIKHDSDALCVAARRGLDAPVPSCPGWTVRDLIAHTGRLHRQKAFVVRERLTDRDFTMEPQTGDLVDWFSEGSSLLVKALSAVDPSTAVWSWHEADQTAGFWLRRMAHETLIHRVDAELAHGTVTPIDPLLAEDGIDEALTLFISSSPPQAKAEPGSAIIRLSTQNRHWSLREAKFSGVTRRGRELSQVPAVMLEQDLAEWDCEISGEPAALDLWLWGRGPLSDLSVSGDTAHAEFLRKISASLT